MVMHCADGGVQMECGEEEEKVVDEEVEPEELAGQLSQETPLYAGFSPRSLSAESASDDKDHEEHEGQLPTAQVEEHDEQRPMAQSKSEATHTRVVKSILKKQRWH